MSKKRKTKSSKKIPKAKIAENLKQTLAQYIEGKRFTPCNLEVLLQKLQIADIHKELFAIIALDFVKKKKLKLQNGVFTKPSSNELVTGIISIHHKKGFGFVKAAQGPDIFIPKHLVQDAVDGDTVEVEVNPVVSAKGPEGGVVAVLKRSRSHLAVTITYFDGRNFIGFSPLLGEEKKVVLPAKPALEEGDRIICKVKDWNLDKNKISAELDRKIGHISDPTIDIKAAVEEFNLAVDFSKEAVQEAKKFGKKVTVENLENRKDFTQLECVTIDPDTAKDFDDAISLSITDKNHFLLGVHIADVAHYVKPQSHLDTEAFARCNSTYFPGKCVPMLPEALSNELCSLKPKVIRNTQSVMAKFDQNGNLIHYEIVRSCIKSAKRFTYKEAFAVLEKKKKSKHAPLLKRMVDLCHLLKQKRMERGSIDFAMAENYLVVDDQGVPQKFEKIEYDITHQMIEEFMLKANEIVATHLNRQGKNLIYRIHEEPTNESFNDFYTYARALGFKLPVKPTHLDIQKLFAEAKSSPFLPQLSVGFIRSMRLAAYSQENIGHYGLALEHYCHFTSPIRRYSDLIIQRLLFNEISSDVNLQEIANACSEKERISFKAEMSVLGLKKLRFANEIFKNDPMRTYEAVITKVKPFALFFEVIDLSLEGSFHISEIGNDYYEYNEKRLSFRGKRTGKTFTSGQTICVRLEKIDIVTRQSVWKICS